MAKGIVSEKEIVACPFCFKEPLSAKERDQDLCGDCYDLRRVIRHFRKGKRSGRPSEKVRG